MLQTLLKYIVARLSTVLNVLRWSVGIPQRNSTNGAARSSFAARTKIQNRCCIVSSYSFLDSGYSIFTIVSRQVLDNWSRMNRARIRYVPAFTLGALCRLCIAFEEAHRRMSVFAPSRAFLDLAHTINHRHLRQKSEGVSQYSTCCWQFQFPSITETHRISARCSHSD